MSDSHPDYDACLEALRSATTTDAHQEEIHARLVERGIFAAGTATAVLASNAPAAAAASSKLLWATKLLGAWKIALASSVLAASLVTVAVLSRQPQAPAARPAQATPARVALEPQEPPAQAAPVDPPVHPPRSALPEAEAPVHSAAPRSRKPATARMARPAPAPHTDLARENDLLLRATERLHADDRAGAAQLLDQYDQEFPRGVLRHERDIARKRSMLSPGSHDELTQPSAQQRRPEGDVP